MTQAKQFKFTLYWKDGRRQVVQGPDMLTACQNAGIPGSEVAFVDIYRNGDNLDYRWDNTLKTWVRDLPEIPYED